jgi:tetratricopeptide (TPR) repeat protein
MNRFAMSGRRTATGAALLCLLLHACCIGPDCYGEEEEAALLSSVVEDIGEDIRDNVPAGAKRMLIRTGDSEASRYAGNMLAHLFKSRYASEAFIAFPGLEDGPEDSATLSKNHLSRLRRADCETALILQEADGDGNAIRAVLYELNDGRRIYESVYPFRYGERLAFLAPHSGATPGELDAKDEGWLRLLEQVFPAVNPTEDSAFALAEGDYFFKRGFWRAAAERFNTAVEDTSNSDAFLHRVIALYMAGDVDVAREIVDAGLEKYPDSGPMYALKAWIVLRDGAPDDALMLLEQARLSDVTREGFYLFARYLVQNERERYQEAAESLFRAADVLPDNAFVQLSAGRYCWRQARLENAVEFYRRALAAGANGPQVFVEMGMALDASGEKQEALEILRKGVERYPAHLVLSQHLASLLKITGDYAGAVDVLESLARVCEHSAEAAIAWGDAAEVAWHTDEATRAYEEALQRDPASRLARLGLARIALRKSRPEAAKAVLHDMMQEEKRYCPAVILFARALAEEKQHEAAVEILEDAATDSDCEYSARIALSEVLCAIGRYEAAVEEARIALAIKAGARSYAALARAFLKGGELDSAMNAVKKGLEVQNTPELHLVSGLIYLARADIAEEGKDAVLQQALDAVNKALDMYPVFPDALACRGRISARRGEWQRAVGDLEKAAELDRWDPQLSWELAELLRNQLDRSEDAARYYRRHIELNGRYAEKAQALLGLKSP